MKIYYINQYDEYSTLQEVNEDTKTDDARFVSLHHYEELQEINRDLMKAEQDLARVNTILIYRIKNLREALLSIPGKGTLIAAQALRQDDEPPAPTDTKEGK